MDADVPVVESGGKDRLSIRRGEYSMRFPPAHVDRVLHDGDTVRLGGTVLTAHLTAGHTKGTTTWTIERDRRTAACCTSSSSAAPMSTPATSWSATRPIRKSPRTTSAALRCSKACPATSSSARTAPTSASLKNMRAGRTATQRLHRSRRLQSLYRRPRAGI